MEVLYLIKHSEVKITQQRKWSDIMESIRDVNWGFKSTKSVCSVILSTSFIKDNGNYWHIQLITKQLFFMNNYCFLTSTVCTHKYKLLHPQTNYCTHKQNFYARKQKLLHPQTNYCTHKQITTPTNINYYTHKQKWHTHKQKLLHPQTIVQTDKFQSMLTILTLCLIIHLLHCHAPFWKCQT